MGTAEFKIQFYQNLQIFCLKSLVAIYLPKIMG